jgi:thioredoxin reductase
LFCHGYEERGAASAGVLAIDDCAQAARAIHLARFANRLASKVTIYTNGNTEVTKEIEAALWALRPESKMRKNVTVEGRKILKLVKLPNKAEIEVQLEGGEEKAEGFIAHKPQSQQQGPWAEQLGLELTDVGDIKVNPPFNATDVPGVFAGGDCQTMMKGATVALSHGALLAAGVASQLEAED